MIIQTNIAAINAHRNLTTVGGGKATAARRLSSGFRINSAADDAAGLAISEKMRAQIRGLDQAYRNAQDGIALIRTAEGGISTINEMLIRMRELVVQAANDTYTLLYDYFTRPDDTVERRKTSQRVLIQDEIDQLIQEIDGLSQRVQFNSRTLLAADRGAASRFVPKPRSIILPPAEQLAYAVSAMLDPANAIVPLASPPAPTVVIDSSNFAQGGIEGVWEVTANGALVISNSSEVIKIDGTDLTDLNRIVVQPGTTANVILYNVNIETSLGAAFDMRGATVDLWLSEGSENYLHTWNINRAALETTGGTVRINGNGTLTANLAYTHNALETNHARGAAIGGGVNEDGGTIIINGGTVITNSRRGSFAQSQGAGIGGGGGSQAGTIIINGGNVQAHSSWNGAAIGGGRHGDGGNITINGGYISATAVEGAGIGGGNGRVEIGTAIHGNGGNITINGGNVVLATSQSGAGIGGGRYGNGGNIFINGGNINASNAPTSSGAGIGGGSHGDGGNIMITGGHVIAGSGVGAGIGGGWTRGNGANLTISGGNITATSAMGAGIGSGVGFGQNSGTVTILAGIVNAGSETAAAVGGGGQGGPYIPSGVDLTVSGGILEITQGWIGAGVILGGDPDDPANQQQNHGLTTYANGNISFGAAEPHIPGGVFDSAQNPLYHHQVIFEEAIAPHTLVTFLLYVNGDYRQFNGYTDSLGQFFVWLPYPPDPSDPKIPIVPPDPPDPPILISAEPTPSYGLWLQTGANVGQGLALYIEAVDALTIGLIDIAGNPAINVMLESGYEISPLLNVLDGALTHVNTVRATLGAVQNRLEFTSQNLQISSENQSAAESRIRDADMAYEKMIFVQSQVLHQTAISILAQANQNQHAVLQLVQELG